MIQIPESMKESDHHRNLITSY